MNAVVQFLKRLAQILFFLVVVVFLGSLLIGAGGLIAALRSPVENVEKPSILALDLDGIIVDTRDIVESLRKYRTEDRIKDAIHCCASTRRAAWSDRRSGTFGPS